MKIDIFNIKKYLRTPGDATLARVGHVNAAVNAAARPYKVYTALLSQTGTNAPVATILENTLGVVPTYSYGGAGEYKVIHTDGFTLNKTVVFMNTALNSQTASILIDYQSNDAIHISTFDTTPQNDILFNTSIEIRVYN